MNTNNSAVQVAAIVGIVVIVLALIAATVYAPSSGINNLLTLITGVITVFLGLAKLQSVENKVNAGVAISTSNSIKADDMQKKLDVVHDAVNGINAAALTNQAIVSEAKGEARGDAAGFERGVNQREASDVRPAV